MKKISALILSTAMAVSLISGCSKEPATPSDGTAASSAATSAATSDATAAAGPADSQEPQTFEELYGSQLMNYLDHQYYFDGEAIPTTESNFYFINAFLDLSNYANMGYYPSTTLGFIDLSASFTGEEYATFGDYYIEYAENSLESTCILNARAKEAGTVLSDETKQAIDDMFENIKNTSAANSGMTLDEYLQFYYGPGNDEATFRKVLERYYIADAYSKEYCDNYEFTDDVKNVPYIRYALFYAPEGSAQEDLDKALAAANAMKDACSSIDDLTGLAENAQANGTVYDQGDIAVPKGQMVPKFEEWAYEEGRTEGELDVIFAPEYGYFVVGYLGLKEQSKDALDKIALNDLSQSVLDEVNADTHGFHTDDVYLPAPAAPTPTEVPEVTLDFSDSTFDVNATVPQGGTVNNGNMSTTDVLVVVFITLAAVAVVAVVVILVSYALKNGKENANNSRGSRPAPKKAGKYEDEKSASSKKNKSDNKSKPSKKIEDEDEEIDEEEEEDYEDDSEDEDDE